MDDMLIYPTRQADVSDWFDNGVGRRGPRYMMVTVDEYDSDLSPVYADDEKDLGVMFRCYDEPHAPVQEIFDLRKDKEEQFAQYPCWEAPSRRELHRDPDAPTLLDSISVWIYQITFTALGVLALFAAIFVLFITCWFFLIIWPITVTLIAAGLFYAIYSDYKKGWENFKRTLKGDY